MVEFNGLGHSAAIHSKNAELVKQFGTAVKAIRVIWNSPVTFGGIGDVYNAFLPSLTLGCGSYGHYSVGDNVSAINLLNIKKNRPPEKQYAVVQSTAQNLFRTRCGAK